MDSRVERMKFQQFDLVVLGSGFSGSLLAWIVAKAGRRVLLVDPVPHPRFAIGESSTPLADFLLEQIADEFQLPEVAELSRWGRWQQKHSQLRAGKKRGFSYFRHQLGQEFSECASHENSLLVAASASDELSDTHWLRSDVDQWFFRNAVAAGAAACCPGKVTNITRREPWRILVQTSRESGDSETTEVEAAQIVDASGAAAVIPNSLDVAKLDSQLQTRSGAVFGHFEGVGSMDGWLRLNRASTAGDPFASDDAAQHHVLDDGWIWMLRFAHGVTSVGRVWHHMPEEFRDKPRQTLQDQWTAEIHRWPTLASLMSHAELIAPVSRLSSAGEQQPSLQIASRMSRLWSAAAGEDWLLLPSTAGVIDPLHSTGIAHSLWGVRQVARILLDRPSAISRPNYSNSIVSEVRLVDRLVSSAYQSQRHGFDLFCGASCLYFISAIQCEAQMAAGGQLHDGFLCWQNNEIQEVVNWFSDQVAKDSVESRILLEELRRRIEPWNSAGLLDPALNNRIARSAADK